MCITYSILSCKLAISFPTFPTSILSGKNGKLLWSSCHFSVSWISTSKKYPSSLSSLKLFIKSSRSYLLSTQSYLPETYATFPIHINYIHPNTEYMTILYFLIIFHVFVISFCISINRVIYCSSYTFFYC